MSSPGDDQLLAPATGGQSTRRHARRTRVACQNCRYRPRETSLVLSQRQRNRSCGSHRLRPSQDYADHAIAARKLDVRASGLFVLFVRD